MTYAVTAIQVYTPTADAEEDVINCFYTDLQNKVSREHKNDIIIIMGDFNAKVGSGSRMDYSVMGAYGFRQKNDRGIACLTSAIQMIYTYPTQNSSRANHQDAGHGNS